MSLFARLFIAMAAIAVVTSATIGLLAVRNIESGILPGVLGEFKLHVGLLAENLGDPVEVARGDVLALSRAVPILAFAAIADNSGTISGIDVAKWRQLLTDRFQAELAAKPQYSQMRFIGRADNGREIVRVDRSGLNGSVRSVPDDELQSRGAEPYFKDTMRLSPNGLYLSEIAFIASPL